MHTHENIKRLRESLGLSQEELASKVGYKDRSSIAKVESGSVDLTQSKIAAFASALNVTPAELMGVAPYSSDELMDLYVCGIIKWTTDFRLSDKQQIKAKEYFADLLFKAKEYANMIANSCQSDGKILANPALLKAENDLTHWASIGLKYVNEDLAYDDDPFSEDNIRDQYLSAIRKMSIEDQYRWLVRIQDFVDLNYPAKEE